MTGSLDDEPISTARTPPPIIEHFACSDYCPGPREQYLVKIFQGVTDEEACRQLGGTPSSYTRWGVFHICLAPSSQLPSSSRKSTTEEEKLRQIEMPKRAF